MDIGHALIRRGFVILRGWQSQELCDEARADYRNHLVIHAAESSTNRDAQGRQFRLANFHLASRAAMLLAKNPRVMALLDFLFGREAAVHTSLTFQYSTMQTLHRDSPYFHTFPRSQFLGVWTALEDIDPDSGPLSYVPGSHRKHIDQHAMFNSAMCESGDRRQAQSEALHQYQRIVTEFGESLAPREFAILKKGDVAIWHPELVHGGSPAKRPELTRHSMVVHCCPADVFVFTDEVFLQHQSAEAPTPYYAYEEGDGRKHGGFGRPGFMSSI